MCPVRKIHPELHHGTSEMLQAEVTHATNKPEDAFSCCHWPVPQHTHTHTHTQHYGPFPHLCSYAFCTSRCVKSRLSKSKQTHTDTRGDPPTDSEPKHQISAAQSFLTSEVYTLYYLGTTQQNQGSPPVISPSAPAQILHQKIILKIKLWRCFKQWILAARKLHMTLPLPRVQNAVCCWLCIINDSPRIIYESFSSPAVCSRLNLTACDVINHPSKMFVSHFSFLGPPRHTARRRRPPAEARWERLKPQGGRGSMLLSCWSST